MVLTICKTRFWIVVKITAPFASVIFEKGAAKRRAHRFHYYSAKKAALVEGLQVVSLSKPDLHVVAQSDFVANDELWKVYWWGGHRDEALVRALRTEVTLRGVVGPDTPDFPSTMTCSVMRPWLTTGANASSAAFA